MSSLRSDASMRRELASKNIYDKTVDKYEIMSIITYEQIFICYNGVIQMSEEKEVKCTECPMHVECGGKNIELVKRLQDKMITEEEAYYVSELFKALSDMTRVRILFSLLGGEMCVCDIQELVGVTQSAVSHQLRTLKQAGLVKYRRDGKSLYYSIADDHVSTMLAMGLEHISE